MILIDYIFIVITVIFSFIGILRGFSSQLVSFFSWSLFLFIIFYHLKYFTDFLSLYISLEYTLIRILTISLLAILTILLVFILNLTLAKVLASTLFQNSNRIIGFFMSFIKSQIYIFIFILIIIDTPIYGSIMENSFFTPYYLELIKYISNYDDSLFNSFEI